MVRRLAAAARVERGPVDYDPVGIGREDLGIPLAEGLVVQFKAVRAPLRVVHARKPTGGRLAAQRTASR